MQADRQEQEEQVFEVTIVDNDNVGLGELVFPKSLKLMDLRALINEHIEIEADFRFLSQGIAQYKFNEKRIPAHKIIQNYNLEQKDTQNNQPEVNLPELNDEDSKLYGEEEWYNEDAGQAQENIQTHWNIQQENPEEKQSFLPVIFITILPQSTIKSHNQIGQTNSLHKENPNLLQNSQSKKQQLLNKRVQKQAENSSTNTVQNTQAPKIPQQTTRAPLVQKPFQGFQKIQQNPPLQSPEPVEKPVQKPIEKPVQKPRAVMPVKKPLRVFPKSQDIKYGVGGNLPMGRRPKLLESEMYIKKLQSMKWGQCQDFNQDKSGKFTLNHTGVPIDMDHFAAFDWTRAEAFIFDDCFIDDSAWQALLSNAYLFPNLTKLSIAGNWIQHVKSEDLEHLRLKELNFGLTEDKDHGLSAKSKEEIREYRNRTPDCKVIYPIDVGLRHLIVLLALGAIFFLLIFFGKI